MNEDPTLGFKQYVGITYYHKNHEQKLNILENMDKVIEYLDNFPLIENSDNKINQLPAILNVIQAAGFLGISKNTLYKWQSLGYFKGCSRRRGKHLLFNRDKLEAMIFFGPEWKRT